MDALERARLRLEEWIHHSQHHKEDYERLAQELEALGKSESASSVRRMVELTSQGTESLKRALEALGR